MSGDELAFVEVFHSVESQDSQVTQAFLDEFETRTRCPDVAVFNGSHALNTFIRSRVGSPPNIEIDSSLLEHPSGIGQLLLQRDLRNWSQVVPPTVLLNADRSEVMAALSEPPLLAAIEKYALFSWWKHRDRPRAFWVHGYRRWAERLRGFHVVMSPLYSTPKLCAFGTPSVGLPELLARYLEVALADDSPQDAF